MQLKPGTTLQNGKYCILRTLGQGGFGITYEAEQVMLHRMVALKEFFMKDCCEREDATSRVTVGTGSQRALVEKFRGKFIREAQMMAGMDHPNIVRVTDVFDENETAYYVMDNLPGGSLKSKVESQGPLSEAVAEKYIRQVADALAYIHSQNTVHLDVKPSNILLNSRGEAVLIDFGISKHYDKAGEQTSSTPVGVSKGFAPLEQGRDGDVSQFQPSTDIYAMGATLYFLVSGKVPPEASIVVEDGIPRPVGLSDRMWNAVSQAMKPIRRDRPQNVKAFLQILGSTPTSDHAPQPENPPVKDEEEDTFVEKRTFATGHGSLNGHEWVDLGLPSGLKWATCNVGASSPDDSGDFFAWGETEPKENYSWRFYLLQSGINWLGDVKRLTKYNSHEEFGAVDDKNTLEPMDDVASVKWGKRWRMPTKNEQEELQKHCDWTWMKQGGKNGYMVTGKNGNSIFLPAIGFRRGTDLDGNGSFGYYWLSSRGYNLSSHANYLFFGSYAYDTCSCLGDRCCGCPVRPVTE